jgi:DnaJ-class molecular chaperone
MSDPYAVLGIARNASQDAIKKAYRKLAKELHPDVNPGDSAVEQKFKEVSAAYNILSDAEKRAKFDRGEINADGTPRYDSAFHQAYSGAGSGSEFSFGGAEFEDLFSDLFSRARSGGRAQRAQARGKDVQYSVQASFEEAAKGGRRRVRLFDGKSVDLAIPPGTEDGQTLRLRGQGMAGLGGAQAGDALVTIQVPPHAFFRREGRDIHVTLPVTLDEAVLGSKIAVPTIDGRVTVTVPAGSNTGTRLRLKAKGIPAGSGGGRGNQYVHIEVVLPEKPDEELKSFLDVWSKRHPYDVRKKAGLE